MRSLIQVERRPGREAAQPSITPSMSVSMRTCRSRCAQRAREPPGHVHLVERKDAAVLWLDPVERRVLRALGHGEDAAGVRLEQHLRRDLDDDVVARSHANCRARKPSQSIPKPLGDRVPPEPSRRNLEKNSQTRRGVRPISPSPGTFPASGCRRARWRCRAGATRSWNSGIVVSMPSITNSDSAPLQPHHAFVARLAVHDELADEAVVVGRDAVALIDAADRRARRARPADANR